MKVKEIKDRGWSLSLTNKNYTENNRFEKFGEINFSESAQRDNPALFSFKRK